MNPSTIHTSALNGVEAPSVTVEVGITNGLPGITIVGLAKKEVRESASRVRHALRSSRFEMPLSSITVNLAPVELPKSGGRYDIPIALGILAASKQIDPAILAGVEFLGELALTGALRPVPGVLPSLLAASRRGRTLFLPEANSAEAGLVKAARAVAVTDLRQLVDCLYAHGEPERVAYSGDRVRAAAYPELNDVIEMAQAKRAMEIAAAGGHNLLLSGPPGAGKSMLAKRFPGLLPPMSEEEALETATLHSLKGIALEENWRRRPFRNPHHTCSVAALVGGGARPTPGEISLAHNGVLFLDELPQFRRDALESLREPLETRNIVVSRARYTVTFPARFQLLAAMNPCPCGFVGDPQRECRCTPEAVRRYQGRISGPFLDRVDLRVQVCRPERPILADHPRDGNGISSAQVRTRVVEAREIQMDRSTKCNAELEDVELRVHCRPRQDGRVLLEHAARKLALSPRACARILKVARTIADLESAVRVAERHIAEALALRGSGFT
ncbi:MAG: YifB family Mg chelatase-like AAA ATPase [Gammaproteobacteria bacterium]|nr:YifB family Mg chelatase-like AAA ATPase [Gammaproteobacteria bacterium]MYF58082.1 YifB family Mg chelatase-like AAA ATPase [Gammaproteobacteria bacterium]